jgi:hypothetical protein
MVAAGRGKLETGAKWRSGCASPPPLEEKDNGFILFYFVK